MSTQTSDVIVVGAGIIGASTAWRLAQAGMRVVLVERGEMGREASWAGAGMLAPAGEASDSTDDTLFMLESLAMYPDFVAELREESGCAIDLRREGALELAFTPEEEEALDPRAAWLDSLGIPSTRLTPGEVRVLAPLAATPLAARFYAGDALVDPRQVVQALRQACLRRKVVIREQTAVLRISAPPHRARVETSAGPLKSEVAVLAAGAWSGNIACELIPRTIPPSYPVRGHLIAYQLPEDSIRPLLRRGHTYVAQRSSGWTIAGSSTESVGFDRTISEDVVSDIQTRAQSLVPSLARTSLAAVWNGLRPGGGPHIGPVSGTSLWLAYGHYRNGILLAPATAARVVSGITRKETGSPAIRGNP